MNVNDVANRARNTYLYLSQGRTWIPNGRPPLPIADMDPGWRSNAANWLLRRAAGLADAYGLGEVAAMHLPAARVVLGLDKDGNDILGPEVSFAPPEGSMAADALERGMEEEHEQRTADPEAWLKTMPLYQALVAGLPDDANQLAKHWSDCPVRAGSSTCTCQEHHLSECPKREDINATCLCLDTTPEWTL